jgi:dienelactone hydrolase
MTRISSVALAALALVLAGCLSDSSDPDAPQPATGSTGVPDIDPASSTFRVQFDPLKALVPYPNDILGFLAAPDTDGSLNVPQQPLQPLAPAINELDGFSTNGRIQANFTRPVDADSLSAASVFLLEVAIDPATKAVVGLSDETLCKLGLAPMPPCPFAPTGNPFLVQGVDYEVELAPDINAGAQTVQLKPLKPLNGNRDNQFTPGTENGYLLILTNGIRDTSGTAVQPDATYAQIRQGYLAGAIQLPPPGTPLPDDLTTEELLALYIAAHLEVSKTLELPVENIVVTASFTTLDTTTVSETVAEMAAPGPSQLGRVVTPVPLPNEQAPGGVLPAGTPVTSALVLGLQGVDAAGIPGEGDVYAGGLVIPYYLGSAANPQDTAPLNDFWVAASPSPLDGESLNLNKYNPVPAKRADQTVPVVITIPNANTAYAQATTGGVSAPKPPTGWPVVIFNHGITRNRLDMFAITEPFNNAGFAVIAMDLALHGIAAAEIDFANTPPEELGEIIANNPSALLRVPGVPERTFDLDLLDNATGGTVGDPDGDGDADGDGIIDPSGAHFINLSVPLVSRDNLRQSSADLATLARSIPAMDIDGDATPDFDGSRIYFVGLSLGAISAIPWLAVDDTAVTATVAVPGGVLTDLLLDSFSFGPRIEAGLRAASAVLEPNTSVYNNFIRDLQNIVDAGDPISHAAAAAAVRPIHFIGVEGDRVVPNSAQNRLAAEMQKAGLTDYTFSPTPVVDPAGLKARVCFVGEGASHGSLLDPGSPPPDGTQTPESLTVTGEMQAQTLVFAAGNPTVPLPGDGQTLVFGASGSPLAPTVYGDPATDCHAPDRQRANTN